MNWPMSSPQITRMLGRLRAWVSAARGPSLQARQNKAASQRGGVAIGCAEIGLAETPVELMADIVRSYRLAEISESERDSLLAYVCDDDESDA